MPSIFGSRTLLPLEAAFPAGRTVFGTLHFQISARELIKCFWKLSPDSKFGYGLSGVACLCNADVASSGDHVPRWACDLKIPSSALVDSH